MKKTLVACALLVSSPLVLADDIYLFDQGPGFIYVTGGGGVAGMLNDDWSHTADNVAVQQPSSKTTTVGTVNGAIGYGFGDLPVRLELAYRWFGEAKYTWDQLFTEAPYGNGEAKINSQAGLFNLYVDWRNNSKFTPFIGGGVGYYNNRSTFSEGSNESDTHTNNGLAWAVMAGVKYVIGPNWELDLRADYTGLGKVTVYEYNPSHTEIELMETSRYAAVSGMMNLTYTFSLGQF